MNRRRIGKTVRVTVRRGYQFLAFLRAGSNNGGSILLGTTQVMGSALFLSLLLDTFQQVNVLEQKRQGEGVGNVYSSSWNPELSGF